MTPRTMRALAELVDALREEASRLEQTHDHLRPREVATELAVHHNWILELIARGDIKATRFGRTYRVERSEVERLKAEGIPARPHRPRLISGGAHA